MARLAAEHVGQEPLADHQALAAEPLGAVRHGVVGAGHEVVDEVGVEHQGSGVAAQLVEQTLLRRGQFDGRLHPVDTSDGV